MYILPFLTFKLCMSLCGYVHLSVGAHGLNFPEAGVTRWQLMWMLGVDLSPLQEQDQFYLLSHLTNLENILL